MRGSRSAHAVGVTRHRRYCGRTVGPPTERHMVRTADEARPHHYGRLQPRRRHRRPAEALPVVDEPAVARASSGPSRRPGGARVAVADPDRGRVGPAVRSRWCWPTRCHRPVDGLRLREPQARAPIPAGNGPDSALVRSARPLLVSGDPAGRPDVCSAKGCQAPPWELLWNNPKLHTPERRRPGWPASAPRTRWRTSWGRAGSSKDGRPAPDG